MGLPYHYTTNQAFPKAYRRNNILPFGDTTTLVTSLSRLIAFTPGTSKEKPPSIFSLQEPSSPPDLLQNKIDDEPAVRIRQLNDLHYAAGNVIHPAYCENDTIGGRTYTGRRTDANYNADTFDRIRMNNSITAKSAITAVHLFAGGYVRVLSSGRFYVV